MNKIKIIKNIMKTNRSNERKQYTISIPDIIGQILEIETNKILYLTMKKPGTYIVATTNPHHEEQEARKIFPNGNCNYFTLPTNLLKHMNKDQINKAIFQINFEVTNKEIGQNGIITLNIE